jgi:hypothetical protein
MRAADQEKQADGDDRWAPKRAISEPVKKLGPNIARRATGCRAPRRLVVMMHGHGERRRVMTKLISA